VGPGSGVDPQPRGRREAEKVLPPNGRAGIGDLASWGAGKRWSDCRNGQSPARMDGYYVGGSHNFGPPLRALGRRRQSDGAGTMAAGGPARKGPSLPPERWDRLAGRRSGGRAVTRTSCDRPFPPWEGRLQRWGAPRRRTRRCAAVYVEGGDLVPWPVHAALRGATAGRPSAQPAVRLHADLRADTKGGRGYSPDPTLTGLLGFWPYGRASLLIGSPCCRSLSEGP